MKIIEKQLLKAGPTARKLGVPVSWLKAEAEADKIPHLKAGRVFLFNPDVVEQVLVERASKGGIMNRQQIKAIKQGLYNIQIRSSK